MSEHQSDNSRHPDSAPPSYDQSQTNQSSHTVSDQVKNARKLEKKTNKGYLKQQLKEEKTYFTTEHLLKLSEELDPVNSIKDKFTLASLYAKSTNITLLQQADIWLRELLNENHHEQLGEEYKRDCCFLLGWTHFHLGNYTEARKYAERLVQKDPHNSQAVEFVELIDERISKEGTKGLILGGLGIAASTAVFGSLGLVGAAIFLKSRANQK